VDIGADETKTAGTPPVDHTPPVSYTRNVPAYLTLATDNAGNTEAPPASPDSTTIVKSHFLGSRIYVNGSATGVESGEDWAHAYHSIGSALELAVRWGVKEIWVARGRYGESLKLVSGVALYGGFAGNETRLADRNIPANPTVIDGSQANAGKPAQNVVLIPAVALPRTRECMAIPGGTGGSPVMVRKAWVNGRESRASRPCHILWLPFLELPYRA
jgi:hypothetical protein